MAGAASARPSDTIEPMQESLVREELERVCADKLFKETTRMKRFLRYVVEETLDGRGDRLKGYVIGVEVFDRPDDFDPQADTIVRVQAGQLRRRLDLYYADRGKTSVVRILIPKGRYAPTFELRQNSQLDEDADPMAVVKDESSRSDDPRPSLAVMTLDDLSSQNFDDGNHFAEGLSAEIVNALVQFRSLRIVTLTPTVSTTLGQNSVKDIGKEYGADFVLSGSVRREGEVFRVTVSLIRCDSSEHVFSRVFDREYKPGSLFNLQEEIASYTAAAVAAPYGAVNRYNRRRLVGRQSSMAAYNCILRYYDIKLAPTRRAVVELLDEVIRVTDDQPKFSTGWAIRALLNVFLVTQVNPTGDATARLKEANRTARHALKVDGQNSLAYFALYQVFYHQGKFDDANRMIRRSMSLNPNDYSVVAFYAVCLAVRGDLETATVMNGAALRLIGRAPTWYYMPQMIVDFSNGQYDDVVGLADLESEDVPYGFYFMGIAAKALAGDVEGASAVIAKTISKYPNYVAEATEVLKLWHFNDNLSHKIGTGLSLAGLDIDALKSSTL
ncbi:MAG: hypothetical protein ABJN22_07155 [Litorimonas sp.]